MAVDVGWGNTTPEISDGRPEKGPPDPGYRSSRSVAGK
jgi:hypothetical protein